MPTYAFCVLQTFHRLCKTSESVRPLELWEGRGEGVTGELTGQLSGLQQFLPLTPETSGSNQRLFQEEEVQFDLGFLLSSSKVGGSTQINCCLHVPARRNQPSGSPSVSPSRSSKVVIKVRRGSLSPTEGGVSLKITLRPRLCNET